MTRIMGFLLLTATLAGQGCLGMEKLPWEREVVETKNETPAPTTKPAAAPKPSSPRLLTANDVTEANALEVAAGLSKELEQAASEPETPATTPARSDRIVPKDE